MNYLFYYSGQIPDYVEISLNSVLNSDPDANIFFYSQNKKNYKNIKFYDSRKIKSLLTQKVEELNYFRNGDQNPLWESSMMRIFYLNDLANYLKINEFVHFDSDVISYEPFENISNYFQKNTLNITPLTKNFLVYGFSYLNNLEIFNYICEEIYKILKNSKEYEFEYYQGTRLNEMKCLYIVFEKNPQLFNLLPVIPTKNSLIFDPGSYGQYLGGVNYKNFSKKYVNKEHIVGNFIINNRCKISFENSPIIKYQNKIIQIANLHVHKKNLKKFIPKESKWKTR